MKQTALDLVHVIWGDDHGIVSLKQGKVLFYVYGKMRGHHAAVPTVEIEDADFALLMAPMANDPTCFEATWADVPNLLNHPDFRLNERMEESD